MHKAVTKRSNLALQRRYLVTIFKLQLLFVAYVQLEICRKCGFHLSESFFLMLLFQFSEGMFSSYEDANKFETKTVIEEVKKNSKPSILLFTTNNGPAIRSSNITGVFPDSYELYRQAGLESAMVLKNTPECSFCGSTNKLLTAHQSDYPDAIVDHVLFNKTLSNRIVEVTVRPVLLQILSFSILEKKISLHKLDFACSHTKQELGHVLTNRQPFNYVIIAYMPQMRGFFFP